jgi:hypothetical protein
LVEFLLCPNAADAFPSGGRSALTDGLKHGTQIASIIAGRSPTALKNGSQFEGIAYESTISFMDLHEATVSSTIQLPASLLNGFFHFASPFVKHFSSW